MYSVYALIVLLLISFTTGAEAYDDQVWYVGKGIQKGMYLKYRISYLDHLESGGKPFNATIWFESQDEHGNWKTLTMINEHGKMTTSNMTLSTTNLQPIGSSYSASFAPYKNTIRNSLGWIGDIAKKDDPKVLSVGSHWGVLSLPGGTAIEVKAMGTETLQLTGKSWNTTAVAFHYHDVDSKIWIADNFPLPVKAKVYAYPYPYEKPVPILFEYELLEAGQSDTPLPEFPLGIVGVIATIMVTMVVLSRFKIDKVN